MTDQRLRDLLHERVADETMPDLSARAWEAGRRVRRRRAALTVGASAGLIAALAVGVAVPAGRDAAPPPAQTPSPPPTSPGVPTPTPTTTAPRGSTTPDASYQGVPIWWAPTPEEELALPLAVDAPLPPVLDLRAPPSGGPVEHAVAAFASGDVVHLVGPQGVLRDVDVSFLDDQPGADARPGPPTHLAMLSPTGHYLAFPQDGAVAVYTVPTGEWRRFGVGDEPTDHLTWLSEETLILPPAPGARGAWVRVDGRRAGSGAQTIHPPGFDTGEARPYGKWRTAAGQGQAQSWSAGAALPVPDASYDPRRTQFLSTLVEGRSAALAFPDGRDGVLERPAECCGVASWLDEDHVVYDSRGPAGGSVVAWQPGTHRFTLVSRVVGAYDAASFTRLYEQPEGSAYRPR